MNIETLSRTATVGAGGDPTNPLSRSVSRTLNGKTTDEVYDGTAKRTTITTPLGRTNITTFNGQGKIVN